MPLTPIAVVLLALCLLVPTSASAHVLSLDRAERRSDSVAERVCNKVNNSGKARCLKAGVKRCERTRDHSIECQLFFMAREDGIQGRCVTWLRLRLTDDESGALKITDPYEHECWVTQF